MEILSYYSTYQFYILGLILNSENKTKQLSLSALLGKSTKYIRKFLRKTVNFDELFLQLIGILNIDLAKGYFIIDGTVYSKAYSRVLKNLYSLFSSSNKSYTKGYEVILLCWSNGKITLPISFKIWHRDLPKTQLDIAMELIKYARKISKDKNLGFRIDAFFNAKKILGYLQKNHIFFCTRLGKSRLFFQEGKKMNLKSTSFGKKCINGWLPGIGYVWVTKYKGKYYCANRCPDSQKQLYQWYTERWDIECVFRFVKSELKLEHCQGFEFIQHHNHIGYCFLAYALLRAMFPDVNPYEAKRKLQSMLVQKSVSLKPQGKKLCA